ncbi:MAG: hypothetical protein ACOY9Y_08450, partial [Bacillota bacterium]
LPWPQSEFHTRLHYDNAILSLAEYTLCDFAILAPAKSKFLSFKFLSLSLTLITFLAGTAVQIQYCKALKAA